MKILDPTIWERHGISTFSGFKQQFGVWVNKPFGPGGRLIAVCDSYKNLDQLNKIILTVCDRLTKDDVLDLPPKLFTKRYVDLNAEQQRIYDGLKYDMQADLGDGNGVTEAVLPIVRLLRYQQVICGYVPNQDGELQRIAGPNYRLGAIEDIDAETSSPGLIWARFTEDINQIMHILGDSAVRYDGTISDDEKEVSKRAFKAGDKKWFVGNAAAGRTGLTLNEGKTVVYYSNYFNLEYRLQSEDRNHRIGQNDSVNYIDLVAQDTVDEHIIKCMRNNFDIASKITGDTLKEWI
jgi:SNF2 family DNA or RNA helicase